MKTEKISELNENESGLAVSFYDKAVDSEVLTFERIAKRVLGKTTFADYPHAEAFERECRESFKLARDYSA